MRMMRSEGTFGAQGATLDIYGGNEMEGLRGIDGRIGWMDSIYSVIERY